MGVQVSKLEGMVAQQLVQPHPQIAPVISQLSPQLLRIGSCSDLPPLFDHRKQNSQYGTLDTQRFQQYSLTGASAQNSASNLWSKTSIKKHEFAESSNRLSKVLSDMQEQYEGVQ
ncbi:hypothetical protein SS50377_23936 [Spironucleus salmonicida]|uniref:Uncharacterized protein n=1 Tax=Spironucleus salmonicida TaxID=348837 RepID=V6M4P9_9EUKA|nr:hypothetical protein SS50377_23936 [Spironucleus salmonicida]|eukprot:EST48329.1 Hypothetical protein SS50377_11533 [Spironucleus salmonicida]